MSTSIGEKTSPLTFYITPILTRKRKVIIPSLHNNTLQFQLTDKDVERAKYLFDNKQKCYYVFAVEYIACAVNGILLTYSELGGIVSENDNVMAMAEMFNAKVVEL